jgi:outer membrane protein assembly factor BamB
MLRGCPDCGSTWREPTARFCGTCGARLVERTDDTPNRQRHINLPTATQGSRILGGVVVVALVAATLTWAASRPPQIREIDVAVPAPTELQEPPDQQDAMPRCVVAGLEQDCVTWQLDARIAGVQQHGKLLVVLRQHGRVEGINPATGDVVWSTGTPIANGSLFGAPVPGRVLVMGESRVMMLDAGSGTPIGSWDGWIGAWSDARFTVVGAFDVGEPGTAPPTLLVDVVSGQTDAWELDVNEHLYHVGEPVISVVTNDNPHTNELRAYAENGALLWSVSGENWPATVGDLVYTVALIDAGRTAEVRALDPATGQVVWTSGTAFESVWSTPVLASDVLVLVADNHLIAFDPETGEERWRTPTDMGRIFVYESGRPGEVVVGIWSDPGLSRLKGLDADTGAQLWEGPTLDNELVDPSRFTDDGLLTTSGRQFAIQHWDGTVTSFQFTAPFRSSNSSFVSLDPLVVSSGYRLYGIDRDIALSAGPQPSESE